MAHVALFSINADNVERAQKFYTNVFGWKYNAYGPPGFFMIDFGPPKPIEHASLQQRRALLPGVRMNGLECTISVDDIRKTAAAIEKNGGKIVMQICTLAGIGQLLFFEDPEGNLLGAMQYDSQAQ